LIHWVASSPTHNSPIHAKVCVINPLFKSNNPTAHPDGFLADINPASKEVFSNAMIETGFEDIRCRAPWPAEPSEENMIKANDGEDGGKHNGLAQSETVRFQGMRMGYFCVDTMSTVRELVLNRIVSLKEDMGKD
jgi:glutaminyl-tRNA synthetase